MEAMAGVTFFVFFLRIENRAAAFKEVDASTSND
jgi:hypothetical protein